MCPNLLLRVILTGLDSSYFLYIQVPITNTGPRDPRNESNPDSEGSGLICEEVFYLNRHRFLPSDLGSFILVKNCGSKRQSGDPFIFILV